MISTNTKMFALLARKSARKVASSSYAMHQAKDRLGQRLHSDANDGGRHFLFVNIFDNESAALIAWNVAYWTRVAELCERDKGSFLSKWTKVIRATT